MVQITPNDIVSRIVKCEISITDGIPSLLDRRTGLFSPREGLQIDYKQFLDPTKSSSVAETARDILGFSNSEGGLLLIGVDDIEHRPCGHTALDIHHLREAVGHYIGARVSFNIEKVALNLHGKRETVYVIHINRSQNTYPTLLRKDIELRPLLIRKLKYLSGTLFYREGSSTLSISPVGDVETKAHELRFSGVAPRTRTSFLLQEDRPGLRLYAPINDRFYGRDEEVSELISKFDDPRGRGVSIAGFGGVGKTELAIRIASELHRRGKFRRIYSGSAKQTLLTTMGVQQSDPIFTDLHTFLSDLAAWLGINVAPATSDIDLKALCLNELKKHHNEKILLFVDNLETVSESNRDLLNFLDTELPLNCWILATARVHKVRNFVYQKELRQMDASNAGRLLRHELKRQGLDQLAATPIADLARKAESLYFHPLAVRWFAWICKKKKEVWTIGVDKTAEADLESFCVAHTLGSLDASTQKVLGATSAVAGVADDTFDCISRTSGVSESLIEPALWDLECSGLVIAGTREDGQTTYTVAQLARRPVAELVRKEGWEGEYVRNLRSYVRKQTGHTGESQLALDLLAIEPREIQDYTREERLELDARIVRVMEKVSPGSKVRLQWLRAECQRHLGNAVTSDELYREIADLVLPANQTAIAPADRVRLLLEASTVAKIRAQTPVQLQRAISSLIPIENDHAAKSRALGMLTEMYAMLGMRPAYEEYSKRVERYKAQDPYQDNYALDGALSRAKTAIERIST